MEYCPFAQRALLALSAKGIEHDVINCCLGPNKPQFLKDANPNGEVPVLLHDGNILYESDIIVEYVDEVFPQGRKLCPTDALSLAKGRILIKNFGSKVIPRFYKTLHDPNDENRDNLLNALDAWVEKPLRQLGTPFFGGQDYNFVDVNNWPWLERLDALQELNLVVALDKDRFPKFLEYAKRMKAAPGISELVHTPEEFKTFYDSYKSGDPKYNYHAKRPLYCKGSGV
jgi:glutathione S-transferase